jgi:hypothetical protein
MKKLLIALIAITLFSCTKEAKQSTEITKSKKSQAVLEASDLTLTLSGDTFTTTISADAEWGGLQRFVSMTTNDSAVSLCNWNWTGVQAPSSKTCSSSGSGFYRSWTSDKNYDIHLSNVIQIQ